MKCLSIELKLVLYLAHQTNGFRFVIASLCRSRQQSSRSGCLSGIFPFSSLLKWSRFEDDEGM